MEPLRFAVLGLGAGGLYAAMALGVVLVYRASGVLNFAQGAIGMVSAMLFFELRDEREMAWQAALALAVALGAGIGFLVYVLAMHPLRDASQLVRVIATLGVLIFLLYAADLRWGPDLHIVRGILPDDVVRPVADLSISVDRLLLVAGAIVLTVVLALVYGRTAFGLQTSAVAENPQAAAALGFSPSVVAAANWAVGGALAASAAVFSAPIVGRQVTQLSLLVIPALAAALVGSFRHYGATLAGALGIGVAESLLGRYAADVIGLSRSFPLVVIVLVLVVRGTALPTRGETGLRLPTVGSGRVRPVWVAAGVGLLAVLIVVLPANWVVPLTTSLLYGIVLLSLVVITGYAGQVSLAQMVLAGMGAWIAGRLIANYDVPFELALVAGVAGCIPLGMAVGLPALRARGVQLAIATLALALVLEHMVLTNPRRTGGLDGTPIGRPRFLGMDIDSTVHPERYAFFVLAFVVLLSLMVANLRRGRSGRRLIAARENERAASSLGINVMGAKLYAFGLSSAIAALGGVLIAYRHPNVAFTEFSLLASINAVAFAVIGGIGFVLGPVIAALSFAPAGFLARPFRDTGDVERVLNLVAGLLVVATMILHRHGIAQVPAHAIEVAARRRRDRDGSTLAAAPVAVGTADDRDGGSTDDPARVEAARVDALTLEVRGLTVRYGTVDAVRDLSLVLEPGQILGLIGPNGAGKTTLIDAVAGFVRASAGIVRLGGHDVTRARAHDRARRGLGRSFQSLELFADMTIRDNIRVAADPRGAASYLTDLVRPGDVPLTLAAMAAIAEFGLGEDLDKRPDELPYGRRRLVAIARAVAAEPSILLLDEPEAGLDDDEIGELADLLTRLAREWGIAILLVAHDVDLVRRVSDWVHVIDFGRTIAAAPPERALSDPAVAEAYLGDGAAEPASAVG